MVIKAEFAELKDIRPGTLIYAKVVAYMNMQAFS